jgi:hemerythrin
MEWKAEFETGIAEIDSQHQTIIQLVTEFDAAVEAETDWDGIHFLIVHAKEFAKFHFATEESLMQEINYPRLRAHRSEHRFVLRQIGDLEHAVLRKDVAIDLVPRFHIWLLGHFLESDRHFVEFMRSRPRLQK